MDVLQRNIKLLLAYDGTEYFGWQRQKDVPTVQGVLEEKVGVMTGEKVVFHGAGRTDAGVHALGMVANFNTGTTVPAKAFLFGLNSLLPPDIRILQADEVGTGFHARRSALRKIYVYRFVNERIMLPTERRYAALLRGDFQVDPVRTCLDHIVGEHDFSSFEASGSRLRDKQGGRGAIRRIFTAEVHREPQNMQCMQIIIAGDGFLRHMVRNIVGTLFEVGLNRLSVDEFRDILRVRDRSVAGPTAPANGLFLQKVLYE